MAESALQLVILGTLTREPTTNQRSRQARADGRLEECATALFLRLRRTTAEPFGLAAIEVRVRGVQAARAAERLHTGDHAMVAGRLHRIEEPDGAGGTRSREVLLADAVAKSLEPTGPITKEAHHA